MTISLYPWSRGGNGSYICGVVVRKESNTAFALTSPPSIGFLLKDKDTIALFKGEFI